MDVFCCEDAVIVFLNPWGLSQLSIQLKVQTQVHHHPAETSRRELMLPFCALRPSKGNEGLMSANQPGRVVTMLMLLALLLISYGVGSVRCSTVPDNSTDMLSLLDFKAIIYDPRQALSSWHAGIPYCHWEGVSCSLTHPGRVTVLNLTSCNLQGQIPPSLGNLTFLRMVDFGSNGFFGQLPTLNRLHRLQYLLLGRNKLQGFNPDALANCSNLVALDLSANSLEGSIPPNIGLLSNLKILFLPENNFTGIIPSGLHNITNLVQLVLSKNTLQGSIPEELGQLSNMARLKLGGNRLSGEIPASLLNHSYLAVLDLNTNSLQMALPSNFGNSLPSLSGINLGSNLFEGQIPAALGNASFLKYIYLHENNFSGQVPSSLGRLLNLTSLILDGNKLEANGSESWEFLEALSSCGSLQLLSLSNNWLQGSIPNSVGNLPAHLTYLGLDGNNLSGTVPESIGNLTGLNTLALGQNNLTGPVEAWIGNLKNLVVLSLSKNNFTGPIPSSIGGFNQMTRLFLYENKFEGPIPSSLGNLPVLSVLNLSHNNLNGKIPKELFSSTSTLTECVLSYNYLEGPIPLELRNLKQMTELHLSSNRLTGEIPDTLGECTQLQILLMDNNFLTGNISKSLSSLMSLSILNLSHNNLSGSIPIELSRLSSLTQLDLSYNNLQGDIPRYGVFGNASAVSLGGNWRLCGGILDLHMHSCTGASGRKVTQYYLVRVLMPIFGFMSLLLVIYLVVTEKKRGRRPYFSSFPLGQQFPKVSYKDLADATQNFSESNLVGRGGYGSVYRGKLIQDNLEVAVKVLDLDMRGAERSFLSECHTLRGIRHRNLVPIITACSTVELKGSGFKALVYEFMPNGNLDTWLHHKEDGTGKATKALDLTQRLCFAVNIADALDYLHNESGRTIIHCDVKSSNILLDDDMNARLGDFGIANFYRDSKSTSTGDTSSIGVKGTIGYIAPEYARGGRASTSGDVYSFGIVLLEMLTCKRPTDPSFVNEVNIVSFVESNFPEQILHVIDAPLEVECKAITQASTITENEVYQCLFALVQVALSCTRQSPSERVTMREAARKIHLIQTTYAGGKPKHASV